MEGGEILLGDIVLARETCAREAAETGVALEDHATHLIVPGTLHLVGYDHIDDADAAALEALEVKALASLGDRKSVVSGKSVSVRVDLGGRRIIKNKKHNQKTNTG